VIYDKKSSRAIEHHFPGQSASNSLERVGRLAAAKQMLLLPDSFVFATPPCQGGVRAGLAVRKSVSDHVTLQLALLRKIVPRLFSVRIQSHVPKIINRRCGLNSVPADSAAPAIPMPFRNDAPSALVTVHDISTCFTHIVQPVFR